MHRTAQTGDCALPHCPTRRGRSVPGALPNEAPSGRLCRLCRDRLAAALSELPGLHREIEYVLGPTVTGRGERVSGSQSRGLLFNEEASAVRTAMLSVLASWSGVVSGLGARTAVPERKVGPLAAFLLRHLDLLAGHPAVADLAEEIEALIADARKVVGPTTVRQVTLGTCPQPGCAGAVEARMTGGQEAGHGVHCRNGHSWPAGEWLALRRLLSAGAPAPAPRGRTLPTRLAAQAAGVSEATVRKWVSRGKLTRYGSPSRAEYNVDELMALTSG
ncbi:hypothetical protein ACIGQE_11250 [Streptomyces sp. NPDC053429]|uniref:hypothetical protein n=1 Tax=Streptomyces sp. NPDC053429 TaxID=3365702 RepID=UPI0037D48A00